jgi:hypothetical protein
MSLLCGKNPALDAVNAIRDQIKAQLANKKSALGGLASQVSAITSKISDLQAKVTNLDSFQSELAALVGADAAKIAAFKEKWKGKVAELDALVAKTTSGIADALDFCKDVPNVKMNPATGATVQEAKESPTPNTAPAEAEPVEETVVDNSQEVSQGNSGVVPSEVETQFDELIRQPYRQQVTIPLSKKVTETCDEEAAIRLSDEYKSARSSVSIFGGTDNKPEVFKTLEQAKLKTNAAGEVSTQVAKYYDIRLQEVSQDSGALTTSEYFAMKVESLTDRSVYQYMEDIKPWLEKVNTILTPNSEVAKDYYRYKNNTS